MDLTATVKFILLVLVALLFMHTELMAQPGPGAYGSSAATSLWRSLPSRFAERQSVRDYGAACDGVTDDSSALAAATTALAGTGTAVYIPGNCKILMKGAAQPWLNGVAIVGDGVREYGNTGPPYGGALGSTIIIDASLTGSSPFSVSAGWAFRGIDFFWAGQTEAAAVANSGNPTVYPPLIIEHSTDNVVFGEISNCQIENAYDVIDMHNTSNFGFLQFHDNYVFALDRVFYLKGEGAESYFTSNSFSPGAYTYGAQVQVTHHLMDYAALHEDIFYVTGDGSNSAISTTPVGGLHFSSNYVFVAHSLFNVVGGLVYLTSIVGTSLDHVGNGLLSSSGGGYQAVTVSGPAMWLIATFDSTTTQGNALNVASGSSPDNSVIFNGVNITADPGAGMVFNNTQTTNTQNNALEVHGGAIAHVDNLAATPFDGIDFTSTSGGTLIVDGVLINTRNASDTGGVGISIAGSPANVSITGNSIQGFGNPITLTQTTGTCTISGNTSSGSTGSGFAVTGSGLSLCVTGLSNDWDLINNYDNDAGYAVNLWYLPREIGAVAAGGTVSANTIACSFASFSQKVTIANVGARVITNISSTHFQVAVYTVVNSRPGALLASTGNISSATATTVSGALGGSVQVGPGGANASRGVFICFNSDSSATTFTSVGASTGTAVPASILGVGTESLLFTAGNMVTGFSCASSNCTGGSSTFNTWPGSLTGSTWSTITSNVMPAIGFQVSSEP